MGTFITNTEEKNFKKRLETLIKNSAELKFLVGFFYFSGINELYETLKDLYENNQLNHGHIKILVGLNIDEGNYGLYEIASLSKIIDPNKIKEEFFNSFIKAFNSSQLDTKEVYEQVKFFVKLLQEEKLILKKTRDPNHAKLYLFKMNNNIKEVLPNLFITGSSNLTKAGLIAQNEFNVEVKDYGFEEAEDFFDKHWDLAVSVDKDDINKFIKILTNDTFFKEITPFNAYVYLLKTYIDLHKGKTLSREIRELMERKGYKPYTYQLEAVSQAVANCEAHGGTILADVVGLGKTVIACLVAKLLNKRGIVICPPHLIGDENKTSGWKKYLEDFELWGWEVRSVGKLEETLKFVNEHEDIEIVIVDEAHRFRNENTEQYHYLREICRGKTVILLTATPFNNRPSDLFSLLKLFTIPQKSTIVLDENLQAKFIAYENQFRKLAYIKNYHDSRDKKRREKAKRYYKELFDNNEIDMVKVKKYTKALAREIRTILEPVVIRRNRLDLKYYKEKIELPEVKDPIEWFFELTQEQLDFYGYVIDAFAPYNEGGSFSGAIYFPIKYEKGLTDISDYEGLDLNREESFLFTYQRNLYDFMRRLLVKRFESSFGAFYESIKRFKEINETALEFIKKTNKFVLDRSIMDDLVTADTDEILKKLDEYEKDLKEETFDKNYYKIYNLENFKDREKFLKDIKNDLNLFDRLIKKMDEIGLKDNDPKAQRLIEGIKEFLKERRKVVIFTEYLDTAKHLKSILEESFGDDVLFAFGTLSKSTIESLYKNFDAQYKEQEDRYKILLTTDKLSEGFNLNRAGAVINYDIPWNPVRVIQRVGRINRIGKKVYNEIYIVNFFPTEKGADIVKSREIAQTKMFMIHNVLGEDAKIFTPDEEPHPSELYRRLTTYIEEEEESFYTKIKQEFESILENYENILKEIENMPRRVKVAKKGEQKELLVFIKKGKDLFVGYKDYAQKLPKAITFEEAYEKIKTNYDEKALPLSEEFWTHYNLVLEKEAYSKKPKPHPNDLREKAYILLNGLLQSQNEKIKPLRQFISNLIEDIRSYGTLSEYTLSEIVRYENNIEALSQKLSELKNEIGENFLEKLERHLKGITEEIIIAIENQVG
jgi:superfamily II DNA or RNA helicase